MVAFGRLAAAAFLGAFSISAAAAPTRTYEQTAWQRELRQRHAKNAAKRSAEASQKLAERLEGLRPQLMACGVEPSIASLPGKELVERLRREVAVSEVVAGFESHNVSRVDMTLADGINGFGYYQNIWESGHLHSVDWELEKNYWYKHMDISEQEVYGFKKFAKPFRPANLAEAAERASYAMVNLHRLDGGSIFYGDIQAVFATALARDNALVSGVDTGVWEVACRWPEKEKGAPSDMRVNCGSLSESGKPAIGTMDSFDHLFLQSDDYWTTGPYAGNGTLERFACRLLAPWGVAKVRGDDLVRYWEAVLPVRIEFPRDVKFMIASFESLFGTETGSKLRSWCKDNGWVLEWNLGLNAGDRTDSVFWKGIHLGEEISANRRMGDVDVWSHSSAGANVSFSRRQIDAFNGAWVRVMTMRQEATELSPEVWEAEWRQLLEEFQEFRLEPLRADSCSDIEACIGTSVDGKCVCYQSIPAWSGSKYPPKSAIVQRRLKEAKDYFPRSRHLFDNTLAVVYPAPAPTPMPTPTPTQKVKVTYDDGAQNSTVSNSTVQTSTVVKGNFGVSVPANVNACKYAVDPFVNAVMKLALANLTGASSSWIIVALTVPNGNCTSNRRVLAGSTKGRKLAGTDVTVNYDIYVPMTSSSGSSPSVSASAVTLSLTSTTPAALTSAVAAAVTVAQADPTIPSSSFASALMNVTVSSISTPTSTVVTFTTTGTISRNASTSAAAPPRTSQSWKPAWNFCFAAALVGFIMLQQ